MPVKISQKVLYLLIYYILHVQVKVSPNHSEQAQVLLLHVIPSCNCSIRYQRLLPRQPSPELDPPRPPC